MVEEKEIDEPALPRRRKLPRQYDDGLHEGDFSDSMEGFDRRLYFEALDLVIRGIKDCFDQPRYKVHSQPEELLIKAAKREQYEEEFKLVTDFYKEDFDPAQLDLQLKVMSSNIPSESPEDLTSISGYLCELSPPQRALIPAVCTLASLILVLPATNAVSERSFSSLCRVTSCLRSTMS